MVKRARLRRFAPQLSMPPHPPCLRQLWRPRYVALHVSSLLRVRVPRPPYHMADLRTLAPTRVRKSCGAAVRLIPRLPNSDGYARSASLPPVGPDTHCTHLANAILDTPAARLAGPRVGSNVTSAMAGKHNGAERYCLLLLLVTQTYSTAGAIVCVLYDRENVLYLKCLY